MIHLIIRVHLASGTRITIAARDELGVATDLADVLNVHAVGYSFRVETIVAAASPFIRKE